MAPAPSLLLPVLLFWMASPPSSTSTAEASSAYLSPSIRSGVIPAEVLPEDTTVEAPDPHEDRAEEWGASAIEHNNIDGRQSAEKHASSVRQTVHDSGAPKHVQDNVSSKSLPKFSAGLHSSRPYVYDQAAKPLSSLAGEFTYPLYYTSYHLFAPSLAENTRPGLEYFGDPPDSYDSLYYGKYQPLAEDVFEQKFVQLRNDGDHRGDLYAETHRQKRRRKGRVYKTSREGFGADHTAWG